MDQNGDFLVLLPTPEDEPEQDPPLSKAVTQAVAEWKKGLKNSFSYINELDPLFTVAWEAASRERIRSEIAGEDVQPNLAIVHVKATSESYTRHFLRPFEEETSSTSSTSSKSPPQSPSWSQSISADPVINIIQLNLPEDKRHTIHGIHPPQVDFLQVQPKAENGIVDAYTSKLLSIDGMSVAKIRNDLDYMWRRRIYSDVQLAVRSTTRSTDIPEDLEDREQENTMVTIFSCHRSILVARSPYFREVLGVIVKSPISRKGGLSVVALPHKPFTPITTEMILRFLYTGALEFPKSGFSMTDLPLPLDIHRGAEILRIPSLVDLTTAHIMDMLHGLFQGHLSRSYYFQRIGGVWKNMVSFGGCVCCQCSLSVPRLIKFLAEPNVNNPILERGARRALVGLFGAGWCTHEFASLPNDILDTLLLDLKKMIIPRNALALLFAAETGLANINLHYFGPSWNQSVVRLLLSARALIERLICQQPRSCFNCEEWKKVVTGHPTKDNMRAIGQSGSDEMRLKWILEAISRSATPQEANSIHEVLTWFTDALIFPAVQTKEFAEMIVPIKDELIEKSKQMAARHQSLNGSLNSSVLESIRTDPTSIPQSSVSGPSLQYSNPTSRTATTDYGLYYRRLALSDGSADALSDSASTIRKLRKRYSWGTLFSEI